MFTFFALWLALPGISLMVPVLKKQITIKPQNPEFYLLGKKINIENQLHYGLDLQGGSHFVFLLQTDKIPKEDVSVAADSVRAIVERRINFFGVSEPQIVLSKNQNEHRLSVDIPGKKDPQEAIKLIGSAAVLDFREYTPKKIKQGTESAYIPKFKKTKLEGRFLKKATLSFDTNKGYPQVAIKFNKEGAKMFAEITKKNLKKPLAIFLDNQLLTMPTVEQEIKNGEAVINGNFTTDEAKKMIVALNSGALPVPIKLIEQKTLEATLGASNIQKSVYAGLVGLFCLAIFMLVLYKKDGVIALVSLGLYAIYSVAAYKTLGIVLTLSGVAGFILSIGMAVDSNILIYERIKEEKRKTVDKKTAVKKGFFAALSAIKDANINTLIVCFVLFNPLNLYFLPEFGVVRGFAATLALGVIMSLFTGVFITKNLLWSIYKINND